MSFTALFEYHDWDEIKRDIAAKTGQDVEQALDRKHRNLEDFKAMISPAAAAYLGDMAELSHRLTAKRFGKTIQMYIPMYLSNECQNICTYCGFSFDNPLPRKTLSAGEILLEAEHVKQAGFEHILLVTGEANRRVGVDYLKNALRLLKPAFSHLSMEVQPLEEEEYTALIKEGLDAVLVYQETYHKDEYRTHHLKGKKSNFNYRLETPDRLGRAGIHKIGLGVLIGLEDWRTDSFFTALHLTYLEKTYWKTRYAVSFPRLRPFSGGLQPKVEMTDRELVQLICAFRIFNPEVELSLSTREPETLRNHLVKLGITSMSAGSKTNPGGYAVDPQSLEQFEIDDERSPQAVAQMIREQGYQVVWKDWDQGFTFR
jgi:2-iminoacetate synthase